MCWDGMMIIDIDHHDHGRSINHSPPPLRLHDDAVPSRPDVSHDRCACVHSSGYLSTPSESPASGPLPVIPEENEFAQNSARETQCTRRTTLYKRYVY